MRDKIEDLFLLHTYIYALPSKLLMRSMGYSYDRSGRIIRSLIERGYLEEEKIEDTKILKLTKDGLMRVNKLYGIDERIYRKNQERIKSTKGKLRQIKLVSTLQLFSKYIPNYLTDHINFELDLLNSNSKINYVKTKRDKIENMRQEIERRRQNDKNNRWLITTRELRELDETNLKNISSPRALGVVGLETGNYVIYNHFKKMMKAYGAFDERYKELISEVLDNEPNSISFGKSYKILIDSLTKIKNNTIGSYILTNIYYAKQYFVPLTYEGMQQLEIYTIKNFREIMRNALVKEQYHKDISEFLPYDGECLTSTQTKKIYFIGFECDFNEIEYLYSLYGTSEDITLIIYCFQHQATFYETIFPKSTIKILPISRVIEYAKQSNQ